MNARLLHMLLFLGIIVLIATAGCVNTDAITEAVRLLQDTINRVLDESNDWETELDRALDLAENLPDEVRSIVTNELSSTLNRAIATTSGELRCDIQFVRDLIQGDLQRIIARLRNEPLEQPDPTVCTVDPSQINLGLEPNQRTSVVYFGYNMPLDPADGAIQVELVEGDQVVDVSQHLNPATEFQMVLDLGGDGVPLTLESDTIRLLWNGRRLSSIPIIQPICETTTDDFTPDNHTFIPPHTDGDRDFDGNGPEVEVVLQLIALPDRVNGLLVMNASETVSNPIFRGDGTAVRGIDDSLDNLYIPPTDWEIAQIVGSNSAAVEYLDDDHDKDIHGFASGPVREFRVTGDTSGNEAGTETGVEVVFNEITVSLRQVANCVPVP